MIATELKKLKHTRILLLVSLVAMLLSQMATFIGDSKAYIIGVVVAVIIAGARFYYAKKTQASAFKQTLPLLIFLIAVAGPIVLVLYKIIFDSASFFSEQVFSLLFFVLPVTLILLAIRWLNQLISEAQSL